MRQLKRVAIWTSVVLLAGCLCTVWVRYIGLRIRVALAEEQTRYFQEAMEQAQQKQSLDEVAALIQGVRNYYPSGSKQKPGSLLDSMVERSRSNAIATLQERLAMLPRQ